MKVNNYIKVLSAVLIMFGSTIGYSEEKMNTEQASQYIINELARIERNREMNKTDFNKLYDRMVEALDMKQKIVTTFEHQSSLDKDRAISVLSYFISIKEHIFEQYYHMYGYYPKDLDEKLQKLSKRIMDLFQSLSDIMSDRDNSTKEKSFASYINYAIDDIIDLLNEMKTVAKKIKRSKIEKKEFESFIKELDKIIDVLPVLYNVDEYKYSGVLSVL